MLRKYFLVPLLLLLILLIGYSYFADAAVPSAISDLTALSESTSVALRWTTPSASPSITDYSVYYRIYGTSSWTLFSDGVSTSTGTTVTSLTNNTLYEFKVHSLNSDGISTDSNIAQTVPLGQTFSDNFESYALGNINGQNGWVQGGTSVWSVADDAGNKVLSPDGTSQSFSVNSANNSVPSGAGNSRLKVDFKYFGSPSGGPQLWLRRSATSGDSGGYLFFRSIDDTLYLQKQPIGGGHALYTIAVGPVVPLVIGTYYTAELETISLADGSVMINGYIYDQGGTRSAPLVSYIDGSAPFVSGSFAVGRNGASPANYDNLSFYSSIPQATPSVPLSLSGSPGNAKVTLLWSAPLQNGTSAITDYLIEYKLSSDSAWTTFSDGVSTSVSTMVTGLVNGTSYDFRVTAINSSGDGYPSPSISRTPFLPPEYWHILLTGQSLSTGAFASPAISTSQPYNNLMEEDGLEAQGSRSLGPLYEAGVGENGDVETPASGIANTIRAAATTHPIIMSINGHNGTAYSGLKQGTLYYNRGLMQATDSKASVEGDFGGAYIPKAVVAIHGETDYWNGLSSSYEANLVEWQNNYKTDLNAIAGTNEPIPLFIDQMNGMLTGELASAQLSAHIHNPGKIILVGPKYQYLYYSDHLHLTNSSSRRAGELLGKVIKKVLVDGDTWNPLMPTAIERTNNVITISFNIPVPPLAIDTGNMAERDHYGFEFTQTGGNTVTISNVALVSGDSKVQITLSATPTGTDQTIRYAWSCPVDPGAGWCGGAEVATRVGGNIRDSDSYVSEDSSFSTGQPLYNWLVAFSKPITEVVIPPSSGGGYYSGSQYKIKPKTPITLPVSPSVSTCVLYLPTNTKLSRYRTNDKESVKKLQTFLRTVGIAPTLPSTGNFLSLTDAAVRKFQLAYKELILGPWGISKSTGIVAFYTTGQINALNCARAEPLQ